VHGFEVQDQRCGNFSLFVFELGNGKRKEEEEANDDDNTPIFKDGKKIGSES
jgi:hypothetical protein